MDLFRGQQLLKANGAKIAAEYAFKAKQYILVYFAHAASGGFTQVLREFYEVSSVKNPVNLSCDTIRSVVVLRSFYQFQAVKDKGVVVIFVSSDRTPEEMMDFRAEYHSTEWLAAPHESTLSDNLGAEFSVSALPLLVVTSLDGTVLTKDGRADVINYGPRALDIWTEGISKAKRNCTLL